MKRTAFCLILIVLLPAVATAAAQAAGPTRVLLVTGGHEYETNQFLDVFKANPEISFRMVQHPNAHALLQPARAEFDVLVLYDMWQDISEEARSNFVACLRGGKGLVALHHAIASYQKWPEYAELIGAKYYLEKQVVEGVEKARSVYQHDVDFKVHPADPNHPVTRGLQDFMIHDETYKLFDVRPGVHPLLTTEAPTSNPTIAWAKSSGQGRVVYIQLGHDHQAWDNPNYRRLLAQAIRWAAKRD